MALDYAAAHPDEARARIGRNEELLRDSGYDVVHVAEVGLLAAADAVVADAARAGQRGVVRENVIDSAWEREVPAPIPFLSAAQR